MINNFFDNYFKKKLYNHEAEVPADMWSRIEKAKSSRKRYLIFIPLLLCLCIIGTAGYILWDKDKPVALTKTNSPAISKEKSVFNSSVPSSVQSVDKSNSKSKISTNDLRYISSLLQPADHHLTALQELKSIAAQLPSVKKQNASLRKNKDLFENIDEIISDETYRSAYLPTYFAMKQSMLSSVSHSDFPAPAKMAVHRIDCPSSNAPESNVYFEAYGSPLIGIKKMQGYDEAYLAKKDSTENAMLSFGLGFRISKKFGNHFLLKTGLDYTQVNEKFSFRKEEELRITTVVTIKYVNGQEVYDTSTVTEVTYNEKKTVNRYKSISLPLLASYETGNDQWKAAITAGAVFNLHSWNKGEMLDTSYNTITLSDKNNSVYRTGLSVALYGSVAVYKSIAPNLDIFAEPYLRYQLSSMTKDNVVFSQKTHLAGINFGLRYQFNSSRQHNE